MSKKEKADAVATAAAKLDYLLEVINFQNAKIAEIDGRVLALEVANTSKNSGNIR